MNDRSYLSLYDWVFYPDDKETVLFYQKFQFRLGPLMRWVPAHYVTKNLDRRENTRNPPRANGSFERVWFMENSNCSLGVAPFVSRAGYVCVTQSRAR